MCQLALMVSQLIHPQVVSIVIQVVTLVLRTMQTRVLHVNHQLLISFKIHSVLMSALLNTLQIFLTHANHVLVPVLLAHLKQFARLVSLGDCFSDKNASQHVLLPTLP